MFLSEISLVNLAFSNSGVTSAGFGAMTAVCILIVAAVLSTLLMLIRNYKKRRKCDRENVGGISDGRPPIKVSLVSKIYNIRYQR